MEYDFYTCCPIQGCENANKPIRWKHYNCGGYTKINDKGYIRCSKCNVKGKVVDWKFSCESHDFQEPNFQKLILMLTTLQQLMKINNDNFILDLSTKIKNQYKQKKNKFQQENKLPSDFEDESYDSDNYDLDESNSSKDDGSDNNSSNDDESDNINSDENSDLNDDDDDNDDNISDDDSDNSCDKNNSDDNYESEEYDSDYR